MPEAVASRKDVRLGLTLRDGRIAKEMRIYDFTNMLIQLGVLRAKAV